MADNGEYTEAQLPLLGVVLCCTSVPPEKRSDLASIASRMGAVHKFDLTSDVTHLIVGDSDTPKYKFVAKEREDVKCLLPSWIEAVREAWMEGEEADVEMLEKQHALPTFAGLKISVTGFDDLAYRRNLEDLINDNGGEYRGNLTRDITHLIAKEPSGNKYSYAGQWHIKTVSIEWMQDSLARGMILDETSYSLLLPPSERGRTAWLRKTASTTSLGKRPRESGLGKQNSRKLRRTASAKLGSESSGIWPNIVGETINQECVQPDKWQDGVEGAAPVKTECGSADIAQTSGEQRFQHENASRPSAGHDPHRVVRKAGLFEGKSFIIHGYGEKKANILRRHLTSHDAVILREVSSLPYQISEGPSNDYFLLVPHAMPSNNIPALPQGLQQPTIVTDLWFERCLYKKLMTSPSAHVLDRPFFRSPIEGFEDITVSSTAFHDVDLLHISKIIPLIGAKFSEELTLNTSVLICYETVKSSSKRSFAYEHGIPTVTADWLWDCIGRRELLPFDKYLTQPIVPKREAVEPVTLETQGPSNLNEPSKAMTRLAQKGSGAESPDSGSSNLEDAIKTSAPMRHSSTTSCADTSFGAESDTTVTKHSSATPHPQTVPLHEISANASPKPSPSPPKPPSQHPTKTDRTQEEPPSSLGPAISSLLAHHQRAVSNAAERPPLGRRRRQLLGRAPSNLSNRSLSRASSVDTMNTDGLGTPLEPSNHSVRPSQSAHGKAANSKLKDTKDPFATLRAYAEEAEQAESQQSNDVQLTQLGYEDPDVKAWRDRVVRKMGGGEELDAESQANGRMATGRVLEDVSLGGTKGIAGRTRAGGR